MKNLFANVRPIIFVVAHLVAIGIAIESVLKAACTHVVLVIPVLLALAPAVPLCSSREWGPRWVYVVALLVVSVPTLFFTLMISIQAFAFCGRIG